MLSFSRLCATVLIFSQLVFSAETSATYLSPGSILLKPRLEPGVVGQDSKVAAGLHILVIDSEDGVNIIKKKTAVRPVVEVRDRNNLPVAGVLVTFTSPSDGPSVVFANGLRSATAITDAQGRAVAPQSTPVNPGTFQLDVSTSYESERASITISMNNVMSTGTSTGASAGHGLSGTTIAIIAGVAAAAAVGIAVGLSHHGSTPAQTSVSITAGSGATAGAP